jgi:hypothetical protein
MNDLLLSVSALKNLKRLGTRFTPLTDGLYVNQTEFCESLNEYNSKFPQAIDLRREYRRKVLKVGKVLEVLDLIGVASSEKVDHLTTSQSEDEEEEEEEESQSEEESHLTCAEIISQALDNESTDDHFIPIIQIEIPHSDKQIQADIGPPHRLSRDEKKEMIRRLQNENKTIATQIQDLRHGKIQSIKDETDDGQLADIEDSPSVSFVSNPDATPIERRSFHSSQSKTPSSHSTSGRVHSCSKVIAELVPQFEHAVDLVETLARENRNLRRRIKQKKSTSSDYSPRESTRSVTLMSRSHIEKQILLSLRGPRLTDSVDPNGLEFQYVQQWVTTGLDRSLTHFKIVRAADYRMFLAKETTLRNLELVMYPTDDISAIFNHQLPLSLLLFKAIPKFLKGLRNTLILFAADFGKVIVDHHAKSAPPIPSQKRLQKRGFHSLKYTVNGIEHSILLDTSRALPVYAVTFNPHKC